ncbi:pancreatic lipase-related protein 2-like isoform X2 [Anoplophora glabripennis]|uniref:pancreatic lipase-related protein 2-like isoform X2 n=1 Tax=Anoplophora glabripennis TaxID=217634 RepID=UPI00087353D5|nr:pancreatic lipase-related protein 2-like isoform X2 [Anoplophora glabripennis]
MLIINCLVLLAVPASTCFGQILQNTRFRRFPMKAAMKLRNRLKERLDQVRERNTQLICYDIVGCFNLPHKNSPLQKVPEDPKILDTKFYLFTRNINFSHPEVLVYDDNGASLEKSSFNSSKPLKLLVHGYMGRWNDKGFLVLSEAYRKLYDCNVVVMDWHVGARGPQYTNAAANTELVGRQLGMLLELMVEKGMQPRDMHLIGFSLGAHVCGTASEALKVKGYLVGRITGLDAASPLFRNNYLREKYKKLDRGDAKFVDVIHTDASPFITDGFGLWQPIGHVDFFPNGGQEQPGCTDTKGSIVVTHLEGGLSRDIACSHLRAFFLYTESVLNMLKKKENKDICEFTSFTCPGGLTSFEKGYCFPQIEKNSSLVLDPSYLSDIGRFGEDAKGEGVMYFSTKDSSQYCVIFQVHNFKLQR